MQEEVISILEKIKTEYASLNTILVFGSATTPEWTSQSDIDIFLIDETLDDSRSEAIIDNINVEFQKSNFTTVQNDIENERGNLLHRNLSTMIATSTIISTKSPEKINALVQRAKDTLASPPEYTNEDVKMWRYSIADYLSKAEKDIKRNDSIAFYIDTHYVIQNALELSLATHDTYMPQPKNLAQLLSKKDPKFLQIWQEYLTASKPEDQLRTLKKLNAS